MKHLEKSFYCFNISAGTVPGSKDSAKPQAKQQMAAQMQRPSEDPGERRRRACTPKRSLPVLGDIDRYLLIELTSITPATTKIKTDYRNLSIDHMSHQGREAALKHIFKPRLNTVFVPRCCSMCGSACHTQGRALPKLHAHAGGTPK